MTQLQAPHCRLVIPRYPPRLIPFLLVPSGGRGSWLVGVAAAGGVGGALA